jgi:hypothetical protein
MPISLRPAPRLSATLALALATVSIAAGAAPATDDDQWLRALTIRSEALNRLYGLGEWATASAHPNTAEPPIMSAIRIRSQALNRIYGLETNASNGAPHEQSKIAIDAETSAGRPDHRTRWGRRPPRDRRGGGDGGRTQGEGRAPDHLRTRV